MEDSAFDTLITDGESESEIVSVDRRDLKEAISCLANNHWHKPSDLPTNHKVVKSYNLVNLVVSLAKEDEMRMINDIINKQYRPVRITEGTVGAFLFGCKQKDYGDVNRDCSPLCINALGHDKCQHQVWVDQGSTPSRFIRINVPDPPSEIAYVYAKKGFSGFNSNDLSDFGSAGVKKVQVYITEDTTHSLEIPLITLAELEPGSEVTKGPSDKKRSPNTNNSSFNWFPILFLIIIVGIMLYIAYSQNNLRLRSYI